MTRRRKWMLIASGAILLLSAGCVFTYRLPVYHYESSDRGWAEDEIPWKGRDLDLVEARFAAYKDARGDTTLELRRTSKPIWYAWNLLIDNLTNRRWDIPYMEPSAKPRYEGRGG